MGLLTVAGCVYLLRGKMLMLWFFKEHERVSVKEFGSTILQVVEVEPKRRYRDRVNTPS